MKDSIVIVPYDPHWKDEFAEIGAGLRRVLNDRARRIDHIGSTSIALLDAKPVIDIQISIASFEELKAVSEALAPLGYAHRADNGDLSKRYYRESEGMRRTHIHVREQGSFSEQFALLFRDYVRAHRHEAKRYAAIKYALANAHRNNRERYVEEKEPYIWDIMRSASKWSQQVGWKPGTPDA